MPVETHEIHLTTQGFTDIIDVTPSVRAILEKESRLQSGIATISVVGSTASISTIEYEPGLLKDLQEALEVVAPQNKNYHHHERWQDDNGHSHVRSTLMGPSITIPFTQRQLFLGTWQQIILIDFDTRPRDRRVIVQLVGE